MRLAQYFAGIFHNMLPNISQPSIFRGPPYFAASLRNIFLHGPSLSLHEPSLYNVRPRYLDKRPSLRNISLHGPSLSLHGPSLYNARPRYLYKRPSN